MALTPADSCSPEQHQYATFSMPFMHSGHGGMVYLFHRTAHRTEGFELNVSDAVYTSHAVDRQISHTRLSLLFQ